MEKKYSLQIDEDIIYFTSIDVDSNTHLPTNKIDNHRNSMLSNVDTIINISDLETVPLNGSIWNGESFSNSIPELMNQPISSLDNKGIRAHKDYYRFAFLQNNILLGSFYYRKDKQDHELFIAALSSNPTVISEIL
jgi:hypothetical protein